MTTCVRRQRLPSTTGTSPLKSFEFISNKLLEKIVSSNKAFQASREEVVGLFDVFEVKSALLGNLRELLVRVAARKVLVQVVDERRPVQVHKLLPQNLVELVYIGRVRPVRVVHCSIRDALFLALQCSQHHMR